jgi:hypothetical protein
MSEKLEVLEAEGRAPHGVLAQENAIEIDCVYGVLEGPRTGSKVDPTGWTASRMQ